MKTTPWITLLVLATWVSSANAVSVTETWKVTITDSGPFDGFMGFGSFSYESDALIDGDETLDPGSGLEGLDVTILGQTFTEVDDIDFPFLPFLTFTDFVPTDIDFVVGEGPFYDNPISIAEPGVLEIDFASGLTPGAGGGFESEATAFVIPEPTASLSWAAVCWGLSSIRSRRRKD
jgi:hypothetical protein